MAKKIPEGPKGAGLRALKAEAPEVTSKMGFAKNGGLSMDIQKIKKMRLGGQTIEDSTKTIDIPTPKPFTNPIKTAINKVPEKLSNIGKALTTSVDKTKNMKKAKTPDKFKQKIAMRKIKNVAKDVFNRD